MEVYGTRKDCCCKSRQGSPKALAHNAEHQRSKANQAETAEQCGLFHPIIRLVDMGGEHECHGMGSFPQGAEAHLPESSLSLLHHLKIRNRGHRGDRPLGLAHLSKGKRCKIGKETRNLRHQSKTSWTPDRRDGTIVGRASRKLVPG